LKGYYGGQLLSAVSQDANNHIYVVAYAVVDVENKENWKWFLTLLHEDLGDYRQHGWNFMSDMQKVLIF
jgi:L-amino acid N-acyltransferase YncA